MKKLLALALFAAASTSAFAGFQNNNSAAVVDSVAKAKNAKDDAPFSIVGRITACHDDDDCTFQDNTGTIHIDVDDDAWRNITVTPNNQVRISGQVDKDFGFSPTLDVEHIEIVR